MLRKKVDTRVLHVGAANASRYGHARTKPSTVCGAAGAPLCKSYRLPTNGSPSHTPVKHARSGSLSSEPPPPPPPPSSLPFPPQHRRRDGTPPTGWDRCADHAAPTANAIVAVRAAIEALGVDTAVGRAKASALAIHGTPSTTPAAGNQVVATPTVMGADAAASPAATAVPTRPPPSACAPPTHDCGAGAGAARRRRPAPSGTCARSGGRTARHQSDSAGWRKSGTGSASSSGATMNDGRSSLPIRLLASR